MQATCLSNQYPNALSHCTNCNANCATCVGPSGSCQKCVYTPPVIVYPQVNGSALAVCGSNTAQCIYRDAFCLGDCGSGLNGGKCQTCLKGSSVTALTDPNTQSTVFSCIACPINYCTNCYLGANNTVTCSECEVNFVLNNNNATGTLI